MRIGILIGILLCSSSCLVSGDESKVLDEPRDGKKISVGNQAEQFADHSGDLNAYHNCIELFSEDPKEIKTTDDTNYIVAKYSSNKCAKLIVGLYKDQQKNKHTYDTDSHSHYFAEHGSFNAAVEFMKKTGVTCGREGTSDKTKYFLTFPDGSDDNYKRIEIKCKENDNDSFVHVGLDDEDIQKLHITTYHSFTEFPREHHYYRTDDKGVIELHIKLIQTISNKKSNTIFQREEH